MFDSLLTILSLTTPNRALDRAPDLWIKSRIGSLPTTNLLILLRPVRPSTRTYFVKRIRPISRIQFDFTIFQFLGVQPIRSLRLRKLRVHYWLPEVLEEAHKPLTVSRRQPPGGPRPNKVGEGSKGCSLKPGEHCKELDKHHQACTIKIVFLVGQCQNQKDDF